MKVKEILDEVADLISRQLSIEPDENTLCACYNYVESDLSTCYFPILEIDKFFHVDDQIFYKSFSRNPYLIKGVQDFRGDKVEYFCEPAHLKIKKNYDGGTFFVKYYYIPEAKTVDGFCTYGADYKDILIYGTAAEYCMVIKEYEQAEKFNKDFENKIKAMKPKKIKRD